MLPVDEPFYLVRCGLCDLSGRLPLEGRFHDPLLDQSNTIQFNRFSSFSNPLEALSIESHGTETIAGRIYTVVFKFFSRHPRYAQRRRKQKSKRIPMERNK